MNDLQGYKRKKEDLMEEYIKKRLKENIYSYAYELDQSNHFLQNKNEITVIKNMKGQ